MTSVPATANPLEQLPTSSWTDISTGPSRLTIFNASGRGVQLVWLNYEGGDVVYNVLGNGQEAVQDTYSTHVWELRSEDGQRIMQYAGPSARVIVLPSGVSVVGMPGAAAEAPAAEAAAAPQQERSAAGGSSS